MTKLSNIEVIYVGRRRDDSRRVWAIAANFCTLPATKYVCFGFNDSLVVRKTYVGVTRALKEKKRIYVEDKLLKEKVCDAILQEISIRSLKGLPL